MAKTQTVEHSTSTVIDPFTFDIFLHMLIHSDSGVFWCRAVRMGCSSSQMWELWTSDSFPMTICRKCTQSQRRTDWFRELDVLRIIREPEDTVNETSEEVATPRVQASDRRSVTTSRVKIDIFIDWKVSSSVLGARVIHLLPFPPPAIPNTAYGLTGKTLALSSMAASLPRNLHEEETHLSATAPASSLLTRKFPGALVGRGVRTWTDPGCGGKVWPVAVRTPVPIIIRPDPRSNLPPSLRAFCAPCARAKLTATLRMRM
ncbi:uncharacterized protein LOC132385872 [Hypanus sabinus]|uniref:uncharacterized protein LOC132385872 n=1 Tax=Hypanus sabinus TaxID=79690 RepID=UPI0028C39158|nr:uncharacterized protein LOC132385872 [Hypanus sabinus]